MMRRWRLVLVLTLVLPTSPALAQWNPATPAPLSDRTRVGEKRVPGGAQAGSVEPGQRVVVEKTIHDNICWALTKDRARVERTMAHDADLFIINPDSKPTSGWDELVKNFDVWMDPRFKAVTCDVRELQVNFSRSGDVA